MSKLWGFLKTYWRSIGVVILVLATAYSLYQSSETSDEAKSASQKASTLSLRTQQLAKENARLLKKQERETTRRRDQACRGYESQHRQEIVDLERTYRLYENPPAEFASLLDDPIVIEQLQEQVRDSVKDTDEYGVFVAPYCDEPGIGLKEPDPEVPKPPPSVQRYLQAPAA